MTVGTPFDTRAQPLNVKRQWREWAGFFAASTYAASHDIEYNAVRNAAALIDVSPLFKYRVSGPDALALVDRVITRDATRVQPGRVIYTQWCDEHGKVIDDGTVARLDDDSFRWTAAEPQLRWLRMNARGLDVDIEDDSERVAALALQGPLSRSILAAATGADWSDLGYYRRRAGEVFDRRVVGRLAIDVSRTGYTGDLGYELWVDAAEALTLWDVLMTVGADYGIRPAGMLALDVARLEAGLILLEVDYTSSRHALIPEQSYSPYEIGLGRLVDLDKKARFVGRRALEREIDGGGPARRLVGLDLDWDDLERLYSRQGLSPVLSPLAWREQVPIYAGGRQVGRATSGTWSPVLKKNIAIASVEAAHEPAGSRLQLEWTVEGHRGRIGATVVPMPFFDPPRKRA
ncbi:MAG: aminomethyltransferase family protein [Chloroflexota bacterium]|nr:aminomethyltransferase family protein [Chloroflexota bacterium]